MTKQLVEIRHTFIILLLQLNISGLFKSKSSPMRQSAKLHEPECLDVYLYIATCHLMIVTQEERNRSEKIRKFQHRTAIMQGNAMQGSSDGS